MHCPFSLIVLWSYSLCIFFCFLQLIGFIPFVGSIWPPVCLGLPSSSLVLVSQTQVCWPIGSTFALWYHMSVCHPSDFSRLTCTIQLHRGQSSFCLHYRFWASDCALDRPFGWVWSCVSSLVQLNQTWQSGTVNFKVWIPWSDAFDIQFYFETSLKKQHLCLQWSTSFALQIETFTNASII